MSGDPPFDLMVEPMAVEDPMDALLECLWRLLRRKAQVKQHLELAGDHVISAGAGVDVRDLEAGWREVLVALVPALGAELAQCRHCAMHRVIREMRIGDMPLLAVYSQTAAEAATAAVFDDVAEPLMARRLADHSEVDALIARRELLRSRAGCRRSRGLPRRW